MGLAMCDSDLIGAPMWAPNTELKTKKERLNCINSN